ncbi:hypothetical protein GCM10008967_39160 [Bacillus carboniphilus]|uniref:DUF4825 domain-containing protein n=1 Tax=Bacillus carboniphilus TaxID=86663 RepID=A0ABP3GGC4_9BACI
MKKNIYTILIIVFLVIVAANHIWQKHQLEEALQKNQFAKSYLADTFHGDTLSTQLKKTIENPSPGNFSFLFTLWDITHNNIGILLRMNESQLEWEDQVYSCANQVGAMLLTYSNPESAGFEESRLPDLEVLLTEWEEFKRQNANNNLNGVDNSLHLAKTYKNFCENTEIKWP